MSIGIGALLDDGVLLVADGRTHQPFLSPMPLPKDDAIKLERVSPTMAAVSFGYLYASRISLPILKKYISINTNWTPETMERLVFESVDSGWNQMFTQLIGDYDPCHPGMRTALIVGGIASGSPFVTSTLMWRKADGTNGYDTQTRTQGFILLGGEEQHSDDYFSQLGGEAYQQHGDSPDDLAEAVKRAAAETLWMVARFNGAVGGIARYALIRHGRDYEHGILCDLRVASIHGIATQSNLDQPP